VALHLQAAVVMVVALHLLGTAVPLRVVEAMVALLPRRVMAALILRRVMVPHLLKDMEVKHQPSRRIITWHTASAVASSVLL
jgi:hypothetical protein